MDKPKYEKPVARDLSAIQVAQGSCYSGNVEYKITDYCSSGNEAFAPCTVGNIPLAKVFCGTGSDAAASCWNGSAAA